MTDAQTTIAQLREMMEKFVDEREWNQFHNPKNLSIALVAEAAELLELFQWMELEASRDLVEKKKKEVADELADVVTAALMFANACNIDVAAAIEDKMARNRAKYPVEKSRGRYTKYTDL